MQHGAVDQQRRSGKRGRGELGAMSARGHDGALRGFGRRHAGAVRFEIAIGRFEPGEQGTRRHLFDQRLLQQTQITGRAFGGSLTEAELGHAAGALRGRDGRAQNHGAEFLSTDEAALDELLNLRGQPDGADAGHAGIEVRGQGVFGGGADVLHGTRPEAGVHGEDDFGVDQAGQRGLAGGGDSFGVEVAGGGRIALVDALDDAIADQQ